MKFTEEVRKNARWIVISSATLAIMYSLIYAYYFQAEYLLYFLIALLAVVKFSLFWMIPIVIDLKGNPTKKRTVYLRFLASIPFFIAIHALFYLAEREMKIQGADQALLVVQLLFSLFAYLLIWIIYDLQYAVFRTKKVLSELSRSRLEEAENKMNLLKQQLNPHFLFNALNVLKALINIDREKAVKYTVDLAELLRMTIDWEKKEITLEKELELCLLFLDIQNIRFNDSIELQNDIPYTALQRNLPFLTLLMLLENAIKHNIITKTNRLFIHLFVEDNFLVVKNNSTQKSSGEKRSGIGLKNIEHRYLLLYQQHIIIRQQVGSFIVKIPLNR